MEEFEPKITHRIAKMVIMQPRVITPWEYLHNWAWSDRGPDDTLDKLTERMKNRWPGNYKIIAILSPENTGCIDYVFKFSTPAEETMFRMKWS